MPLFAMLLLLLLPSLAYAAGNVAQTPPSGSGALERGTNVLTEHKHRQSQAGDSSGPSEDSSSAGGADQPSNSLTEHRHKETHTGDSPAPPQDGASSGSSPTSGTNGAPDESNPSRKSTKPQGGPAI